jgi:hypothetical protein
MTIVVAIAAVIGALVIAVTVWQIRKRGIPEKTRRWDEHWPSGG